ncbi:hypothetical protein HOE04_01110 [archaeon]|jgi:hypothetical protein|nr:hypothetical protein [archaeon]
MKKIIIQGITLTFLILSSIKTVSAYIDPGTGGYLVTSFGTSILIILGIILGFLSTHIFHPIKKFIKKHYKLIIVILAIIILTMGIFKFWLPKESQEHNKEPFNPSLSGVQVHNKEKAFEGYNLFEGKLIDMNGNLVKEWDYIYLGKLNKNGDYYSQEYYESQKWGKLTFDNKEIWTQNLPIHHEITLTPEEEILTITKETHKYNGRDVEFGIILKFDKNGKEIERWSTWDNLKILQQFHKPLELDRPPNMLVKENAKKNKSIWGGEYDYYHLNAIKVLPENKLSKQHKAFQKGNWLISFRHGSMLFILDKDTKEIVWRAIYDQIQGNLEGQHSPIMLDSGNILIFDNGRYREWSRIIEINPITLEIVWEYKPDDFYTLSQGNVQLLPNNNLLITESEKGRVFEITRDKEIVWEYYHTEEQNESNSAHPESFGTRQWIYKMERYPKEFIDNLLKKSLQ